MEEASTCKQNTIHNYQYLGLRTVTSSFCESLATMGTSLLNYPFKIEFLPSKKIGHADGSSRLIPKLSEPSEETVIAALSTEMEIKTYFSI